MTTNDEASEATPKRSRKKAVNFAKRRTLRFSDSEERAVEDVRQALATSSGRDLAKVTFSEALRLLILDKEATAEVEAKALAMKRSSDDAALGWGVHAISDRLGYEIAPLRNHIAHVGGNVNQIAKRLNSGDPVTSTEISEALEAVAALKAIPEDVERRIALLVQRGLPARGER